MKFHRAASLALATATLSIAAATVPTVAAAQAVEPAPISAYADLPMFEDMTLSPNGELLGVAMRVNGSREVFILNTDKKVFARAPIGDAKLRGLYWVGNDHLLMMTSATKDLGDKYGSGMTEMSRGFLLPADGSELSEVFAKDSTIMNSVQGIYGRRLVDGEWKVYLGGSEMTQRGGRQEVDYFGADLYEYDPKSERAKRIKRGSYGNRYDYLLDANGDVGATLNFERKKDRWTISNGSGREIAEGTSQKGRISLVSFTTDGTGVIYSIEDDDTGDRSRFSVPLAGGTPTEMFKDVEFETLYIDRNNGRLLGYLEEGTDKKPVLFDETKQANLAKVYRAFPESRIGIADWSGDFDEVLIRTNSSRDSGTWYYVNMEEGKALAVGYEREAITPDRVGPISVFEYTAADGLELDGILTLPPGREAKNLPAVMLPHGGPNAHDTVDWDWWAQAFASRGYAVFQPNYRGSTNRDGAFKRMSQGEWGRKMQTDISDGLNALAAKGIVDKDRACIMGWSYGGYAAMAGITLQDGVYRCSVAGAGVSDMTNQYRWNMKRSGRSDYAALILGDAMGDPSTFDAVSPLRSASKANAPILLIHGKDDTVVPFSQSTQMRDALEKAGKPVEFLTLDGEDHWISRSATRQQMLEAALSFIMKHNPPT